MFCSYDVVRANGEYCPLAIDVEEGYACDYSDSSLHGNIDLTVFFIKHKDGYCAEVSRMSLYIDGSDWGPFQGISDALGSTASAEYEEEKRRVISFDLGDDVKSAIDNKSCPWLKTTFYTNGFGDTHVKKMDISIASPLDKASCGFAANIMYNDSFCLTPGGSNFRKVDKEELQHTVEEANEDRDGVDVSAIQLWASKYGYDVDSLGDDCNIINPKLKDILNTVFWIISIAGIVLVVVMTALSFIKAIVGSDDEKFRDAFKHLLTRIIVMVILLLLPTILSFIITIINDNITGTVSIGEDGNVFCDFFK